jgi:hypothetical protein
MHEKALAGSTSGEWREGRPLSASTFYIPGGVPHRSMKFRGVEEAVSRSAILLHNECRAQASEAPIERAVLVDRVHARPNVTFRECQVRNVMGSSR